MDQLLALVSAFFFLLPSVHGQSTECMLGDAPCLFFSQAIYNAYVDETDSSNVRPILPSQLILTTTCNIQNGPLHVTYSLIKRSGSPFGINPMTGEIRVVVPEDLDYETTTGYSFMVVCEDRNNSNINDTATVIVHIQPVNEHRPGVFTASYIINCNTELGPLEGLVHGVAYNVTDPDLPKGPLYFTSDNYIETFSINRSSGQVHLLKRIANTTNRLFPLRVMVCDVYPAASTCQNNVISIVYLTKIPKFSQESYTTSISEAVAINTTLLTVDCIDDGCASNNRAIEIVNESSLNGMISVDEGGRIQTRQELDFEDAESLHFQVRCYNKLTSQTFSLSPVNISVEDENDNPPACPSPTITAILKAGTYANNHLVLQTACTDDDSGANGRLTYSVQGELPKLEEGQFSLDSESGNLTFSGKLPSASHGSYDIFILVADSGMPSLTETVKVTVKVTVNLAGESALTATRSAPMLVIIVASLAGGLLLLCCATLLCLSVLYCLLKHRKSNKRKFYFTSRKDSIARQSPIPNIYEETTSIQELNLHYTNERAHLSMADGSSLSSSGNSGSTSDSSSASSSCVLVVTNTSITVNEPQESITVSTFMPEPEKHEEINDMQSPPDQDSSSEITTNM